MLRSPGSLRKLTDDEHVLTLTLLVASSIKWANKMTFVASCMWLHDDAATSQRGELTWVVDGYPIARNRHQRQCHIARRLRIPCRLFGAV